MVLTVLSVSISISSAGMFLIPLLNGEGGLGSLVCESSLLCARVCVNNTFCPSVVFFFPFLSLKEKELSF